MKQKMHQGRNVKCFREMLVIKQEVLILNFSEDWNQKKISLLEWKIPLKCPLYSSLK